MSARREVMLHNEGQLMVFAAHHDAAGACEHARAVIDGCFNILLRFDGPEETAKYAYALGDRATGGIKAETVWPLPAPQPPAPDQVVTRPAPTRWRRTMKAVFRILAGITFIVGGVVALAALYLSGWLW